MGACNSHSAIATETSNLKHPSASPLATVISISGEVRHYAVPVTAVQVHPPPSESFFVCNSDALVHGEFISELKPEEELLPDNLYFVLPQTKLKRRLNASDMAGLAVRASFALQKEESRRYELAVRRCHNPRRMSNSSSQISPAPVVQSSSNYNRVTFVQRDSKVTAPKSNFYCGEKYRL